MKPTLRAACAAALFALGLTSAQAGVTSFTGSLSGPSAVQFFQFTLGTDSDISLRTWGYAGGTNAAGEVIATGGFDPILSLFAGTGPSALLIDANDDGLGVDIDPATGEAHDAWLSGLHLAAGIYTLALSNFAEFANGPLLGDGFLDAGASFGDRSAAWAVDVIGADEAHAVAEPSGPALVLAALTALGWRARRRA